jgi:hypothetical protein
MTFAKKTQKNFPCGATTVEMTFAMVILITIVFASFEFFRACMLKQYAENVSYEAARHVIVPGGSADEAKIAANRLLNILANCIICSGVARFTCSLLERILPNLSFNACANVPILLFVYKNYLTKNGFVV